MDDTLYDEFGNYIGTEIESDRESDDEVEDEDLQDKQPEEDGSNGEHGPGGSNGWITTINDVEMENQIVLPEDKKYYPTAEEVYGEDVETLVMDEHEQPFEQPIIKPVRDTTTKQGFCIEFYVDLKFVAKEQRICNDFTTKMNFVVKSSLILVVVKSS